MAAGVKCPEEGADVDFIAYGPEAGDGGAGGGWQGGEDVAGELDAEGGVAAGAAREGGFAGGEFAGFDRLKRWSHHGR